MQPEPSGAFLAALTLNKDIKKEIPRSENPANLHLNIDRRLLEMKAENPQFITTTEELTIIYDSLKLRHQDYAALLTEAKPKKSKPKKGVQLAEVAQVKEFDEEKGIAEEKNVKAKPIPTRKTSDDHVPPKRKRK